MEVKALRERMKTFMVVSETSSKSLSKANHEELLLTGNLARLEEQRKRRVVEPQPADSEEIESLHSEEEGQATDDDVVLLSDSDDEEAQQAEEEQGGEGDGVEEDSFDEYEFYRPGAEDPGVRPLSPYELATYQRVMSSHGPENEVLAVHPTTKEELARKDFERLAPRTWLSDEVRISVFSLLP